MSDEPPDDPAAARYRAALKDARDCLDSLVADPKEWTCDEAAAFLDVHERWNFIFYDAAGNSVKVKIYDDLEDIDP